MSIVRLKRIALVGHPADRSALVAALQHFGQLHVIAHDGGNPDEQPLSPRSRRFYQAIRFLEQGPAQRRQLKKTVGVEPDAVVNEVLALQEALRAAEDQREELQKRIRLMRPWGNFGFPPDALVEQFRLWFYRLPVNKRRALEAVTLPWQIVGRDSRHVYVVVVSIEEPPVTLLPVAREHLGSRSLSQLEEELESLEQRLEELYAERQRLTRYLLLLKQQKARADNRSHQRYVLAQTREQDGLFRLDGWIAVVQLDGLLTLARQQGVAVVAVDPAAGDRPPTLLQPAPGFAAGGALARFYQLPAYNGWDPSVHLFLSFVLFFAMILADAGYALVLLLPLLAGWRHWGRQQSRRDSRALVSWMLGGALLWGVLAGSYFGVAPDPDSWLGHLVLVDLADYDLMMKLSVAVGILHLLVANLTQALSHRHDGHKVCERLGWMVMMVSGGIAWMLPALQAAALSGCGVGALMVLAGGYRPQAAGFKAGLQALAGAFIGLLDISKLFGDVLSYMRLFALGLASASLAMTFNQLAASTMAMNSGLALLAAGLILVVGHLVNMGLGIMSGVVHGLRLNFIEFYNWGAPGEGYAFHPFRLEDVEDE